MQGGEVISSSARTISQYCSVCKATLDMSVVDTVQDNEVTWLKCPRCKGILPHMGSDATTPDAKAGEVGSAGAEAVAETPAGFSEEEQASAVDYDPQATYEVDQVIYHRSINRYGKVMEKKVLPGQRYVIHVAFGEDVMILREKL
jgi:hypothetical protein